MVICRVRSRTSRKLHRENQSPLWWTSALLRSMIRPTCVEIVAGVGLHLFLGQLGAGLVAARGVAHQGRVVADDDDGRVAQVLKLAQLAQGNGMPQVHVDAGRVDAVLHAQRAVLADRPLQLLEEFGLRDDLLDPAFQDRKLFGDIPHRAIDLHGDG